MDIKPVPATHPPAPVLKITERKNARREQGGKHDVEQAPPATHESTGGGQLVDAYA